MVFFIQLSFTLIHHSGWYRLNGEEKADLVSPDLLGLCSAAPALCGPAQQLSSPAPLAASAGWPALQLLWPEQQESDRRRSPNKLEVQQFILVTLVQRHTDTLDRDNVT